MIPAADALVRLREGNRRFAADEPANAGSTYRSRRLETAPNQEPFAVILGCSDSRVPAEIVFDQGLGDLFVIRVAGNIVAPSQVGSVEFAAARTGARLVVVLGHSRCGAILATLEEMNRPSTDQSRNLRSIVERIQPAIAPHPGHPDLADRRRADPARRARQRHGVGEPSPPWLGGARAADPDRRPDDRRRRVLPRNRPRRVLRRRLTARFPSTHEAAGP